MTLSSLLLPLVSPPHPDSTTQRSPNPEDDTQDFHQFFVTKEVFDHDHNGSTGHADRCTGTVN